MTFIHGDKQFPTFSTFLSAIRAHWISAEVDVSARRRVFITTVWRVDRKWKAAHTWSLRTRCHW